MNNSIFSTSCIESTQLINLCKNVESTYDIEKISCLIDNGVDINYLDDRGMCALSYALKNAINKKKKYSLDCVKLLLQKGADINNTNNNFYPFDNFLRFSQSNQFINFLEYCATNFDLCRKIICHNESNILMRFYENNMKKAIRVSPNYVRKFISWNIDVNDINGKNETMLWICAKYGDYEIAKILLESGANFIEKTVNDIFMRCLKSKIDLFKKYHFTILLLEYGLELKFFNNNCLLKKHPLEIICEQKSDHCLGNFITLLIRNGADINGLDLKHSEYILSILCDKINTKNDFSMIKQCVKNGVLNHPNSASHIYPIVNLIKNNNCDTSDLIVYFINNGANVDIELWDPDQRPLNYPSTNNLSIIGTVTFLDFFLKKFLKKYNEENAQILELIISKLDLTNNIYCYVIERFLSICKNTITAKKIIPILINAGLEFRPIHVDGIISLNDISCEDLEFFLKIIVPKSESKYNKDDIYNLERDFHFRGLIAGLIHYNTFNEILDSSLKNYDTELEILEGKTRIKNCLKLLLNHGFDINDIFGDYGTFVHYSCLLINHDMVIFAIENGADLNIKDNEGNTPLMFLCRMMENYRANDFPINEVLNIIKTLLDNGTDTSIINNYGSSALTMLCKNYIFKDTDKDLLIKLILKSRTIITHKDYSHNSAYDYYIMHQNEILNEIDIEYLKGTRVKMCTKSANN